MVDLLINRASKNTQEIREQYIYLLFVAILLLLSATTIFKHCISGHQRKFVGLLQKQKWGWTDCFSKMEWKVVWKWPTFPLDSFTLVLVEKQIRSILKTKVSVWCCFAAQHSTEMQHKMFAVQVECWDSNGKRRVGFIVIPETTKCCHKLIPPKNNCRVVLGIQSVCVCVLVFLPLTSCAIINQYELVFAALSWG